MEHVNRTLYIGVTTEIIRRTWQHKENILEGFTRQYEAHILVWSEIHHELMSAVAREKPLKKWKREWKIAPIHGKNPLWRDRYQQITA